MKKYKCYLILIMCLALAQSVFAKNLSNSQMRLIIGKTTSCKDCTGTSEGAKEGKCPYDNPCKDCKESTGTPAGCLYDSESKEYYPGTEVPKCTSSGNNDKYCHVDAGAEHSDCYRRYDCTSDPIEDDKFCDSVKQCTQFLEGYSCRRCKLGNPTPDLNWNSAKEDTCTSTPPSS